MQVGDLLNCTTIILAETELEDFPYRQIGAGFLVSFKDIGIFVTAKHVIAREDPKDILVFPTYSNESIRLISQATIEGDLSFQDLALYPFSSSELDRVAPKWREGALPLTEAAVRNGRTAYHAGQSLALTGIPGEAREIDAVQKKIAVTGKTLPALYEAKDEREWIHRGRVTDDGGLRSFAGFSGSPVLILRPPRWALAGCVIEASGSSGLFHFIDAAVLWRAAEVTHRDMPRSAA